MTFFSGIYPQNIVTVYLHPLNYSASREVSIKKWHLFSGKSFKLLGLRHALNNVIVVNDLMVHHATSDFMLTPILNVTDLKCYYCWGKATFLEYRARPWNIKKSVEHQGQDQGSGHVNHLWNSRNGDFTCISLRLVTENLCLLLVNVAKCGNNDQG